MSDEATSTGATLNTATAVWAVRETRRIVCEVLGNVAAKVILFGSRARGCADRLSDIDVGILPIAVMPPHLLPTIRERLEESDIPFRVDVVDLSEVDETFRKRVLAEGTPWTA
jgi:predicted nucleotidyltransferase